MEQEIHQSKFKSEFQKLYLNILYTGNWIHLRQVRVFKKFQLTPQQYNLLRILRGRAPQAATIQYLTDRMLDRSSNASRLVDKLLAKGLVERHACPTNRRAVDVTITDKGQALLKEIDVLEKGWEKSLANVTLDEANQVNAILDKLRQASAE